MKLKDILAISGEPGLFKFIAQGKNSIIVEHLETGKRSAAYATAKVHSLDEIAVYTESEEVSLSEVLDKIFEKQNGGEAPDHKLSPGELKSFFSEVLPDYDPDRVYNSDIKKIIAWYNFLHKHELIEMDEEEKPDDNKENKDISSDKKKESEPKAE